MCRMLIGIGDVQLSSLLDYAIMMAKDTNDVHEFNEDLGQGSWQHSDGWGVAYLKDGEWVIEKSTKAIFRDPKVEELKDIQTKVAIVHVRKKMGSETHFDNTHPFQINNKEIGNFVFCHNGYVEEEISFSPKFKALGETDSEQLFYSILSNYEEKPILESIRKTLDRYTKCTGTNVILSTKDKSFIGSRENKFPKYYEMQFARKNGMVLISSEKIRTFTEKDWTGLKVGNIMEINHEDLNYTIH